MIVFEVPTGAFADRFGKKVSLLAGSLFLFLSCIIFSMASGFWALTIAYLIWAFGAALGSGADTALLYDILHAHKKSEDFKKYRANAKIFSLVTLAFSGIIGGYLASISMRLTFVASAIAFAFTFIILFLIKHVENKPDKHEKYVDFITESYKIIKSSPSVVWLFAYFAIFGTVFHLVQPSTQIYMNLAGLDIAFFGVASTILFLSGAMGSKYVDGFEKLFKGNSFLIIAILVVIPLLLISRYIFALGFLIFGIIYFATTVNSIIIEHELLRKTPKSKHATILSFGSLFTRLSYTIFAPIWGFSMQLIGLAQTFLFSSIVLIGILSILLISYYWRRYR